jgi:hypothetical protein
MFALVGCGSAAPSQTTPPASSAGGGSASPAGSDGASNPAPGGSVTAKPRIVLAAPAQPSQLTQSAFVLYGADYGLQLTPTDLVRLDSTPNAISSVLAGQGDVVFGGYLSELAAIKQGLPIKIFAVYVFADDFVIAARPPVSTIADLQKPDVSIGVDGPGETANSALQAIFDVNGIQAKVPSMPNIKILSSSGDRTTALAAGQVNAALIHVAQADQVKQTVPDLVTVGSLANGVPNFVLAAVAAPTTWLDANQPTAAAISMSLIRASREMMASFPAYKTAVSTFVKSPPDDAGLMAIWQTARENDFWPWNGGMTDERFAFMNQLAVEEGVFDSGPDQATAIDPRPMQAALAQLGPVDKATLTASPAPSQ